MATKFFEISTPFGAMELQAWDDFDSCNICTVGWVGGRQHQTIAINGIEYYGCMSFESIEGYWQRTTPRTGGNSLSKSINEYMSDAAQRKFVNALIPIVSRWFSENQREILRLQAQAAQERIDRLSNEVAAMELQINGKRLEIYREYAQAQAIEEQLEAIVSAQVGASV